MGGDESLPSRPSGFDYMCIAIRSPDTLRIILGTDNEAIVIRKIIEERWPRGIEKETIHLNGVHEFELKGCPFGEYTSFSEDAATSRMAERILHRLYRDGWKLQISSNLTRTTDLTTWFFKKAPFANDSSQQFLVVRVCSSDTLMVINAPTDLHQLFRDVVKKSWPKVIQKWTYEDGVLLIKLKGFPWCPDGEETVHSRALLQTIISSLLRKQWNLYGNSNLEQRRTNTLFFEHNPNMVLEQPSPTHFTISLNGDDKLRVISASEMSVGAVRDTIKSCWLKGIQKESRYAGSWEFKLRGNPWWPSGGEAVESRFLILTLMDTLQARGWSPVVAIDSSWKLSDKSCLIFRESPPRHSPFFCVSLNETDLMRLINAPEDVVEV